MMTSLPRAAFAAFFVSATTSAVPAAPNPKPSVDPVAAAARIDELVLEGLKKEKLEPNADASDEVFVRRVHLDLIGRTAGVIGAPTPAKLNSAVAAIKTVSRTSLQEKKETGNPMV